MPSPIVLRRLLPVLLLVDGTTALRSAVAPANKGGRTFAREAEIKHGRVAMVSAGALALLANQGAEHPSMVLSSLPVVEQLGFFGAVGALEAAFYLPRVRYNMTEESGGLPGRTLAFAPVTPPPAAVALEDAAGRLAMLAVTAYLLADLTWY